MGAHSMRLPNKAGRPVLPGTTVNHGQRRMAAVHLAGVGN